MAALPAAAEHFEIEENFDTTAEGRLPAGWAASPASFTCGGGDYFGVAAHSGSTMAASALGAEGHTLFTPAFDLAGGKEFTLEFAAMLPGGNPPTVRNLGFDVYAGPSQPGAVADVSKMEKIGSQLPGQVADWTEFAFRYTPEADGSYVFAVRVTPGALATNAGGVFLDTFIFTGDSPTEGIDLSTLLPDEYNEALCHELPESEDFSDASHYSGGVLPTDWLTVGTAVWRTANVAELPAKSGEYYMITPASEYERDERAFTPFYYLTAGVDYTVTFFSHVDGINIHVTLGTEQDSEFHSAPLYSVTRGSDPSRVWTQESFTFTPAHSGAYCLCFAAEGPAYGGSAAIDRFTLTAPGLTPRVEPGAQIRGLFSYMNSHLLSFNGLPVRFVNTSRYADSVEWDIPGAISITELADGSADVVFATSGPHTATLTASNPRGSRSATVSFEVDCMDQPIGQLPLMNYDPAGVNYLGRDQIPAFAETDPYGLDYVSGFNHHYRKFAERYDLPTGDDIQITSLTMWLTNLRYCLMPDGQQQYREPFVVSIYGSNADGTINEARVLGRVTTTMADVFGTLAASIGEGRHVQFAEPVKASGTIYVAFEFSPNMVIDPYDEAIGRSFISLGLVRHLHGATSTYAKTASGWAPLHELDADLQGLGLNWQLWAHYQPIASRVEQVESVSTAVEWFDLQGRRVVAPSHGIYLRHTPGGTTKVRL